MKWLGIFMFVGIMAVASFGNQPDSTDLLFLDTLVHKYSLTFYSPTWQDSLEYYQGMDERYIPARFAYYNTTGDSIVLDSIGVRYKGHSSFLFTYAFGGNSAKTPFKLRFDKYRKHQYFFHCARLNLNNNAYDPSLMREKISYDVVRNYMPAPHAAYADLTIEGRRIGLYTQVEDIDKLFLSRYFPKGRSNLYKAGEDSATLTYLGTEQSNYEPQYVLKTERSVNDWSDLISLLDNLNNVPASDFIPVVGRQLYLDNCLLYAAFNMVFSNFDSYTGSARNFYLYDDSASGHCFTIIPWDLNMSFGQYTNGWDVITQNIVTPSNLAERPLTQRLLENDSLRRVYFRDIQDMIAGPAGTDSIAAMADRIKKVIDAAVQTDPNLFYPYSQFCTDIESDLPIQYGQTTTVIPGIKSFSKKRISNLKAQLAQCLPVAARSTPLSIGAASLACRIRGIGVLAVRYAVDKSESGVRLDLFNACGRRVRSFSEGMRAAGEYECSCDIRDLPPSLYMMKLTTASGAEKTVSVIYTF